MPECTPDGLTEAKIRRCVNGTLIEDWIAVAELCPASALTVPPGGCCGGKDAAKEAAIKLAGEKNWPAKELIAVLKALGS